MEQDKYSIIIKALCALAIFAAILGLAYVLSKQNYKKEAVSPAQSGPLSAEEKYRILEELNRQSSTTAVVSAEKKLEALRSLEKGSTTTISANDKLKMLQELQNKQ